MYITLQLEPTLRKINLPTDHIRNTDIRSSVMLRSVDLCLDTDFPGNPSSRVKQS
jgi:hypothetical protein